MKEKIFTLLEEKNRPYSLSDICQFLAENGSRQQVTTNLNELVSERKVIEKVYGKQKIYCVAQTGGGEDDTRKIDKELNKIQDKLQQVQEQMKSSVSVSNNGDLPLEEALKQKQQIEEELQQLEADLKTLEGNKSEGSTKEDRDSAQKGFDSIIKEYRKRRKLCMEMLDAIFENYPKTKKHLYEDIGIETDDDVNFKLPI